MHSEQKTKVRGALVQKSPSHAGSAQDSKHAAVDSAGLPASLTSLAESILKRSILEPAPTEAPVKSLAHEPSASARVNLLVNLHEQYQPFFEPRKPRIVTQKPHYPEAPRI